MRSTTSETSKQPAPWRGHVYLWEDHGVFIGEAGWAEPHESPATKVCISFDGTFGLSANDSAEHTDHEAALIPAGLKHSIDGRGSRMAMLLIAPEGEFGQRLARISNTGEIVPLDAEILSKLREILASVGPVEQKSIVALDDAVQLIAETHGNGDTSGIDSRVLQSIDWIRKGRETGVLVKEIAAEVELSESRFSHLFSEHVRVPVRRYLLWLRLRDVLHLLASSGSLTDAAHSAGFADSSHLTRTFRSALGIAPTDLTRESSLTSFLR